MSTDKGMCAAVTDRLEAFLLGRKGRENASSHLNGERPVPPEKVGKGTHPPVRRRHDPLTVQSASPDHERDSQTTAAR